MTPKMFRALIALYLLCVVLAVISHIATAPALPEPLRGYVAAQDASSWMTGVGGMVYLALASISTAGLLLFRRWARPLFAVVALAGSVPWDGATVYPPLEYLFVNLEFMLAGAVIALSWAPAVSARFARR
jgi:hypothetical protein